MNIDIANKFTISLNLSIDIFLILIFNFLDNNWYSKL